MMKKNIKKILALFTGQGSISTFGTAQVQTGKFPSKSPFWRLQLVLYAVIDVLFIVFVSIVLVFLLIP